MTLVVCTGLHVELFLDQISYMAGTLSEKAGVRIAVHNSHIHPMVDEFGLDVEPGTATSIAIQLVSGSRDPLAHLLITPIFFQERHCTPALPISFGVF